MNVAKDVSVLIANTPLVEITRINDTKARVFGKLESFNPGGSVKDRLGYAMIVDAEEKELIDKETVIVEPTSGNTGIGLAMMCAVRGYKLVLTMPESMSEERKRLLKAYGAELVLTPARQGMKGAIQKATELLKKYNKAFMPMQFENQSNVEMHKRTTAEEIWKDTEGKLDIFVAGTGTGGTITGVAEQLCDRKKGLQFIAVEPVNSPVLSGGEPGPHKIQGIGPGFIPKIMRVDLLDEVFHVNYENAMETARRLAREEGILAGFSSGANVYAALEVAAREENKDKIIVTIICDTGERYLSTPLFIYNE